MKNWREEAKKLDISLYHRTKIDVIQEIEGSQQAEQPTMKIVIPRKEVIAICCRALKDYAINRGMDPDKEIKVSRWYLQMNRNNMTFFGDYDDTDKQGKTEGGEGITTVDPVSANIAGNEIRYTG